MERLDHSILLPHPCLDGRGREAARLHDNEQQKLKEMLEEIAEIAASTPVGLAHAWNTSFNRPLLQLRLGRTTVRYAIDEDTRTISVEHVVIPEDGVDREGDPPVGKVG